VVIGGIVLAFLFFLGAGAASGKGMKVSRDFVWEGTGSIMAGIVVVITPILLGGIAYLIYTAQ
jgi:hypothetical protein